MKKRVIFIFSFLLLSFSMHSQESFIYIFKKVKYDNKTLSTEQQNIDSVIKSGFDFNDFKPTKSIVEKEYQYKLFYKNGKLKKLSKEVNLREVKEYELQFYPISENIVLAYIILKLKNDEAFLIDGFFTFDLLNKKSFFTGIEEMNYEEGEVVNDQGKLLYREFHVSSEISYKNINVIINVDKNLKSISRFNLSNGKFISYSDIKIEDENISETLYICDTRETQSIQNIKLNDLYRIFNRGRLSTLRIIRCDDVYPECIKGEPLWFSPSLIYRKQPFISPENKNKK